MKIKATGFLMLLIFFLGQPGFAQDKIVTGTVTDENGVPLPGVNVVVQGTSRGANTDFDGNYSLQAAEGQTIQFSSVGFRDQAVTVGSGNTINVTMEEGTALDEVFVVAYGTATKESFTGSAAVVSSDDISDVPTFSFEDALAGKASGVNITKGSGQVGSTTDIQIRGIGSMNASTQPLYVIDGVPVSSGSSGQLGDRIYTSNNVMNSLNTDDIESISILKDAAASALYGSRAANGVVVITTKSGKKGSAPKITLKSSIGFSPSWATDNWEVSSTEQSLDYLYRVYHDFRTSNGDSDTDANAYAVDQLRSRFGVYGYDFATPGNSVGEHVDVIPKTDGVITRPKGQYFDWEDALFRTAVNQSNDISISGGGEKGSYFSSLSYSKDEGRIKVNNSKRFSGRLNLTQQITDFMEFSSKVNIAQTKLSGFNDTDNANANYFQSQRNRLFGVYWPTDYKTGEPWTDRFGNSFTQNHLFHDQQWDNGSRSLRMRAIESLKINILPELSVQSIFSYDNSEIKEHLYYSKLHYNGEGIGKIDQMSTNARTLITSTTANYDKVFNDIHAISFLAGYETEKNTTEFQRASGQNLPSSALHTVATAGDLDANAYSWGNSMISYLTRLEYELDKKYSLSGSYRRDGSSKLSSSARWGNFWSVGASWNIKKEAFMDNLDVISNLRLRASYGVNGTLPPSNYGWRNLTSYSDNYMDVAGGVLSNIGDENLSWETNYSTDIGIEFGLFDQRIFGTIEYFNRDSKDLLQDVPTSRVTGFSSNLKNIGTINNKGVEIQIGGDIIRNKDWTWSASVNGAFITSKVKKLNEGQDIVWFGDIDANSQLIYREGESTLAFWGYDYAGIDHENGKSMYYVNDPDDNQAGDFILNGRGATYDFNKANYTVIGNGIPNVAGGINSTLRYKGVSLGLDFIYRLGGELYDGVDQYVSDDGLYWERTSSKKAVEGMWTPDNKKGPLPQVRGIDNEDPTEYSSRHIYSQSFLRLKNIRLGYNLPSDFVKQIGLSNVRVYGIGTNLLTFSKYKIADPEVNQYATKNWSLPFVKNYTFGIEITL